MELYKLSIENQKGVNAIPLEGQKGANAIDFLQQ